MTGAELKVILTALGLSPAWFASLMNMSMRTVVRWQDDGEIPESAHEELRRVEEATMDAMVAMLCDYDKSPTGAAILKTYRTDEEFGNPDYPASWHRALTFRVMEHLRTEEGEAVRVEWA